MLFTSIQQPAFIVASASGGGHEPNTTAANATAVVVAAVDEADFEFVVSKWVAPLLINLGFVVCLFASCISSVYGEGKPSGHLTIGGIKSAEKIFRDALKLSPLPFLVGIFLAAQTAGEKQRIAVGARRSTRLRKRSGV